MELFIFILTYNKRKERYKDEKKIELRGLELKLCSISPSPHWGILLKWGNVYYKGIVPDSLLSSPQLSDPPARAHTVQLILYSMICLCLLLSTVDN